MTVQPVVTVAGQKAKVSFAGLTPGGISLYQIDFQVSKNAAIGDLDLLVTQGNVASNATKLTIGQ